MWSTECDRLTRFGGQHDRIQHFEHPQRIVARRARRPRLDNGVRELGQLGDAAALDRQRRLGQDARRLEFRNLARMDAQSIVRPPLAPAAAVRADASI